MKRGVWWKEWQTTMSHTLSFSLTSVDLSSLSSHLVLSLHFRHEETVSKDIRISLLGCTRIDDCRRLQLLYCCQKAKRIISFCSLAPTNHPKHSKVFKIISADIWMLYAFVTVLFLRLNVTIAFILLIHNNITARGAARIFKKIYSPVHFYVVHIDNDHPTPQTVESVFLYHCCFGKKPRNVHIFSENILRWGTISIVQAELDCLNVALSMGFVVVVHSFTTHSICKNWISITHSLSIQ
jgi:hypothetical protein